MPPGEPPDHAEIDRDLRGIGERLRELHDELGKRKPIVREDEGEHEHAVDMNPLTPGGERSKRTS
jgi:hypothetical protein